MGKGCLGLELAEKKIRYTYLERRGGEIFLGRMGELPIKEDFSSPVLLTNLVQEILSQESISPSKIFFTVFREDVVIHQITVPKMSSSELEEVIVGEIEKVPVFQEKDFDYIYRSYEEGFDHLNVVFAALGKDMVEFIVKGIKNTKIELCGLEVSVLSSVSLLHPLIKNKEDQALLILDEKVSYLIIFREGRCRFFYVMNTGKVDLYPYGKGKVNNLALINWIEELKRTFKSYFIQQKREKIEHIWFIYDSKDASNLDDVLNKELSPEVIRLSPELFPNFHFEGESEFNPIYLLCCAPVLSYYKKIKSEFPFYHFLRKERLKKVVRKTALAVFLYLFIVGMLLAKVGGGYSLRAKELVFELKEMDAKINLLRIETAQLRREKDEYLAVKKRLLRQATFVRKLNRLSWSRIFAEVASKLPETLALTSFSVSEEGEVKIKGDAFKIETLAEFMRKMESSPVLDGVKFEFLRKRTVKDKKIFNFGILSRLLREKNDAE